MTGPVRPEWLNEECPRWCSGEHDAQWHPADRLHESEGAVVPAITLTRRFDDPRVEVVRVVEPTELVVVVRRYVGQRETWVAIADDRQRIEVTLESAHRLHEALTRVLHGTDTSLSVTSG